jgi:hypothetical protein
VVGAPVNGWVSFSCCAGRYLVNTQTDEQGGLYGHWRALGVFFVLFTSSCLGWRDDEPVSRAEYISVWRWMTRGFFFICMGSVFIVALSLYIFIKCGWLWTGWLSRSEMWHGCCDGSPAKVARVSG